jgi:hypothetical protein
MTLLKQMDKPSMLLPYEQIYIQSFRCNDELILEQQPDEHNPMFELFQYVSMTYVNPTTNQ